MSEEYFIGKKCKVFYNDTQEHVAYIIGIVLHYDSISKEVVIQEEQKSKPTAVTRIRIEVLF